jgi:hypothetical protein
MCSEIVLVKSLSAEKFGSHFKGFRDCAFLHKDALDTDGSGLRNFTS